MSIQITQTVIPLRAGPDGETIIKGQPQEKRFDFRSVSAAMRNVRISNIQKIELKRTGLISFFEGGAEIRLELSGGKYAVRPEVKVEEKKGDLGWQKPEESEHIQKSEKPDADYMTENNLCQKCHGARRDCGVAGCPQIAACE